MRLRRAAAGLVLVLLASLSSVLTTSSAAQANDERFFVTAETRNYYQTCGRFWPSKGVFQTGEGLTDYQINWEFELSQSEIGALHCLRNHFGTEFLELDLRLYGFSAYDDWDEYDVTSTNLPGAVHDEAWEDSSTNLSPGLTNIRIDQLQANVRYHAAIAWRILTGAAPLANMKQRVSFEWVPSHWRQWNPAEAPCDIPYAASGFNPAWCVYSLRAVYDMLPRFSSGWA